MWQWIANDDLGEDDDLVFDNKDLDRLGILEKYRNNLVAAANNDNKNDNVWKWSFEILLVFIFFLTVQICKYFW